MRYRQLLELAASDRDTFQREATRALGKAPQEILLVHGEILFGSVFGEDGKYKGYTASGIRLLESAEIEETRLD